MRFAPSSCFGTDLSWYQTDTFDYFRQKVNCDLQLTLMASSLYRLLGAHIGNGYATTKSRHILRDFIDAVGHVTLTEDEVIVRFQKRAAAGPTHRQEPPPRKLNSPTWESRLGWS